MRKIFLPLIIILSFLICESVNGQIGFCNASAGSVAITSSTGNGCPGNNSTLLTLSGTIRGSIQWVYSIDGVNWVEIDGATGLSYLVNDLDVTTRYAVRATFTGIGGTCSDLSNIIVISIATPVWYKDQDDDHYSDGTSLTQCINPGADYKLASQLTATTGDCNDNNPLAYPGALEVFDGVDNDCDGAVDEGFHDYTIPAGISSISLTLQGAKGGSFKNQQIIQGQPFGSPSMFAAGGAGAKLTVKFAVETNCQAGLKPGGKLRLIVGVTPDAVIRNVGGIPSPIFPGTSGQGGGGGSAILYLAPGASEWVLLAVAGGGGGALITIIQGGNTIPTAGLPAIQQPFDLDKTGASGMGGIGAFIPGILSNPRDPLSAGPPTPLSGGGGGAFGNAINYCGGEKGMEQGGQTLTSVVCIDGRSGGYGFGAGGSGFTALDDPATLFKDEGGSGGGGGGYSGGNGGNGSSPGFGGGSYISDLAIESSWLTSSPADNGSISITTNDDDECCNSDPPVFTSTFTMVPLGCNPTSSDINASLGTASATDACGTPIITSIDGDIITDRCNRSQTRTFTATDASGITSTASRTVRWTEDITEPTVTKGNIASCYKTVTDAENAAKAATTYSDNCSTNDQLNVSVYTEGTCSASITVTVTDACNNSSSVLYTTKIDDIAPVLSLRPENFKINCPSVIFDPPLITANDNCDGAVTVTFNQASTQGSDPAQSSYFNYTVTRTWSASDACGNTVAHIQTITMEDKTPPFLPCPGNVNVSTDAGTCYADVDFNLNGIDFCGMVNTIYYLYYETNEQQVIGSQWRFDAGSYTVTVVSTDVSGNSSRCTIALTVSDTDKPTVITKNIIVQLNAAGNATISNNEVNDGSSDNCTPQANLIFETNIKSFSCSDIGTPVTVTLKVTDASGNTATATATVTVEDKIAPVFTSNFTTVIRGCNPSAGDINIALGTAIATDACGITVTSNDGSISGICFKSQTRTFTVTDASGNTSTASRTVTWTSDYTAPVITTGGTTTTLSCNPSAGDINGALGTATATDGCGMPTLSAGSDGTVVSNGCIRTQTRTWTAIDACSNTSTVSRTVTWTSDITPPVITTGGTTTTLGCNPSAGDINGALGTASATDGCGTPTLSAGSDGTVGSNGCIRTQTRTWTAIDACGNTSTASRTVTWTSDITPPVITTGGTTTTLGCNPTAGDINGALGTASATDGCGTPTLSAGSDGTVGSNGCIRTQTRTWTAIDACGNTSTASRTVTWTSDIAPPVITTSGTTTTLGCNPSAGDINGALGTATATDACSDPTVTPSDGPVSSNGCSRSQTRTFRAIDACGNTSTMTRTITWTYDKIAPTLTSGGTTLTLEWNPSASAIDGALGTATATDACSNPTVTPSDGPVSSDGCSRSQTRTFTAKDGCGNTSTVSREVTWKYDKTPPDITNASPSSCILSPPNHKMRDVAISYSLTDNCGGTIISVLSVSSDEPASGTGDGDTAPDDWYVIDDHNVKLRAERSGSGDGRVYTITIKATDAAGNTSTSSVEVRVTHNITSPKSGQSFKVGSTVSLEGEFWDKPGNSHTATWLIDDNTTVKGTVTEPTATRNGKVTGSYKFTAPGVYKLQMNTKDQNNVVSYANTSGDMEAIIVIYDPNGGYTYGGGYFNSPAGAITSNVSATGKASYGFSVNYFKGATYPKGETQFDFKVGEFEFNALNFEYMSIAGAKAQMKGTGKIIGGQSGINFILTVTDGQLDGTGIDRIRMKIYNKNTMQVYYDNQPGVSDAVNPTMPVQENSTVVISGSNVTDLTLPNQTITKEEQDIVPVADGLQVKVMPNPSSANFRIVVNSNDLKSPVKLLVTDMLGRVIETRITNAGQTITIGDKYISGTYAVRIMQGRKIKQLTLIKLSD